MRPITILSIVFASLSAFAGNTYIEFGQFEKAQSISVAAGALYACSKNEQLDWPKRNAYQFLHFKLVQVNDDYFKLAYRIVAVRDLPVSDRTVVVDEHRKAEALRDGLQTAGFDAVNNGEMNCGEAAAFATEVMEYQE